MQAISGYSTALASFVPLPGTRPRESAPPREAGRTPEDEELRGISRIVTEIHWLLISLVLVCLVFGAVAPSNEPEVIAGLVAYAAFVIGFRYANVLGRETRGKIAVETWVMIGFITWVVWFSGGLESPLLNAYLLVIITSALALGRLCTLLEVGLIAACHVLLTGTPERLLSLPFIGAQVSHLAPLLLVAYITGLFSAEIRAGLERVREMSEKDGLTGLINLRAFGTVAQKLMAQAVRHDRAASVVMFDSDNLKPVNDRYGHEEGNRMLKQLAQVIRDGLRAVDVPARYGGDEFVAFLPDTRGPAALIVAERIRQAIERAPLQVSGEALVCTVSVGVATYPDDGRSLEALMRSADHAMYEAKRRGRNRVLSCHAMRVRAAA